MSKVSAVRWTDAEIAILREHYPAGGVDACLPLLPGRSADAIRAAASRAGIKVDGRTWLPGKPPARQVHSVIHQMHEIIEGEGDKGACAVAARAGLSRQWWQTVKRGRNSPILNSVEAMANALGYELVLRRIEP